MTAIDKEQGNNQSYQQFMANGFVYDQEGNRHRYREHQKYDVSKDAWTHETIAVN